MFVCCQNEYNQHSADAHGSQRNNELNWHIAIFMIIANGKIYQSNSMHPSICQFATREFYEYDILLSIFGGFCIDLSAFHYFIETHFLPNGRFFDHLIFPKEILISASTRNFFSLTIYRLKVFRFISKFQFYFKISVSNFKLKITKVIKIISSRNDYQIWQSFGFFM